MNLDTPPLPPSPSYAPAVALPPGEPLTEADLLTRVVAVGDLARDTGPPPPWLWHGYLGPGRVTLLTSQWKTGKTTLLSLLLARMQQGGELAGQAVAAGKALIISEESQADWRQRIQRLQIGDHVHLLCRPFKAQPTMEQWLALIDTAATLRQRQGIDLVAFDSLAFFLPAHSENLADAMLACLNPLHQLTALGMSVLLGRKGVRTLFDKKGPDTFSPPTASASRCCLLFASKGVGAGAIRLASAWSSAPSGRCCRFSIKQLF